MAEIVLTNVTKRWGSYYAVEALNLVIGDNAFVTLLGPSGCGKTTTLRMIAGLETPTSGRITINGVPVFDSELGINVPANERRVGFLFQNYALWPNMTVYQNISFGLSNIKEEMPTIDYEARSAARMSQILEYPDELVHTIRECIDKKGQLDSEKAVQRLADHYEISGNAAKILLGYSLQETGDPRQQAESIRETYNKQLADIRTQRLSAGLELNERFQLTKAGSIQTSVRKLSKEEIDLIVRQVSRIVKIGMYLDRYPSELSGGQQQRVAIARTLAPGPGVLFMDEPLSNLDAKLRLEMRSELQRLHLQTGSTFIYVTHDQLEAMTLATKICLIDNGVLQQYDQPLTVYNRPTNLFVADFVGNPAINFIESKHLPDSGNQVALTIFDNIKVIFAPQEPMDISSWYRHEDEIDQQGKDQEMLLQKDKKHVEKSNKDSSFKYRIARVDGEPDTSAQSGDTDADFVLGVRPEFIHISDSGTMEGEVFSAMPTGMETTVRIKISDYLLTAVVFGGVLYKIGQKVRFDFAPDNMMLFSRRNGRLITWGTLRIV